MLIILKCWKKNESKFVYYESQEIEKFKIKKTNNLRKKIVEVNLFSYFFRSKNEMRGFYKDSPKELDVLFANFTLSVQKWWEEF